MSERTPMRSSTLYVTDSVVRWLRWMARADEQNTPADAIADELLRAAILARHPNIETVEAEYWRARKALDTEAQQKLTTNKTNT